MDGTDERLMRRGGAGRVSQTARRGAQQARHRARRGHAENQAGAVWTRKWTAERDEEGDQRDDQVTNGWRVQSESSGVTMWNIDCAEWSGVNREALVCAAGCGVGWVLKCSSESVRECELGAALLAECGRTFTVSAVSIGIQECNARHAHIRQQTRSTQLSSPHSALL